MKNKIGKFFAFVAMAATSFGLLAPAAMADTTIGTTVLVRDATSANNDSLQIIGLNGGAATFTGSITTADLTATRTWTLPDVAGTFTLLGNTTTGTGSIVLATSPTLVTPVLGVATATSLNGLTITTSTGTLTITNGKTLSASNTLTLAGTDGTTITFQGTDTYVGRATTDTLTNKTLTDSTTLFQDETDNTKKLALQLSGIATATTRTLTLPDASGTLTLLGNASTGSGSIVLATSPTLVTPALGVATATSINGLTITTSTGTLTITNGKTLSASNTLTLAGTDSTTITFQGTDTYVGRATTDTLTNKTLTDSTTLLQDEADNTKKLAFQLSGIATATTRTITVPDASGTVTLQGNTVTGSGSIVLATSPTLVTPALGAATATSINGLTITTSTGTLTITNGKTLSASNTLTLAGTDSTTITFQGTDTYVGRATTDTLTNKTLTDSTTLFQDETDNTKKLSLQLSGIATATTRTLTLPDASGTVTLLGNASTGSGSVVLATSPTLVTPALGVATATSINGLTITTSTGTLTITNGKTLSASNTLTLAGTDSTTITFQGTDTYVGRATTDTLTNKTLTAPAVNQFTTTSQAFAGAGTDDTTAEWTGQNVLRLTAAAAQTVNLGACASNANKMVWVRVVDTSANNRTINGTNAEGIVPFIGGAKANFIMKNAAAADVVTALFYCDGTDWQVMMQTKQ